MLERPLRVTLTRWVVIVVDIFGTRQRESDWSTLRWLLGWLHGRGNGRGNGRLLGRLLGRLHRWGNWWLYRWVNWSLYRWIHGRVHWRVDWRIHGRVHWRIHRWVDWRENGRVNRRVNWRLHRWIYGRVHWWVDRRLHRWINGRVHRWICWRVNGRVDRWVGRWADGGWGSNRVDVPLHGRLKWRGRSCVLRYVRDWSTRAMKWASIGVEGAWSELVREQRATKITKRHQLLVTSRNYTLCAANWMSIGHIKFHEIDAKTAQPKCGKRIGAKFANKLRNEPLLLAIQRTCALKGLL
jgi:hypothetical protein